MANLVYTICDYDHALKDAGEDKINALIGSKALMLCDLYKNGFPVPNGLIITTEATKEYYAASAPAKPSTPPPAADADAAGGGDEDDSEDNSDAPEPAVAAPPAVSAPPVETVKAELSEALWNEIQEKIKFLEEATKLKYGGENPLFLCCRTSPQQSMHHVLESVPLIGYTQESTKGLASKSEDPKAVWTVYQGMIQTYGTTVAKIPQEKFDDIVNNVRGEKEELEVDDYATVCTNFKELIQTESGSPYPGDNILNVLKESLTKVLDSWRSSKASDYRSENQIEDDEYPAILIQMAITGNKKTNTVSTRDPVTGQGGQPSFDGVEDLPQQTVDKIEELLKKLDRIYKESEKIDFQIDNENNIWILKGEVIKKPQDAELRFLVNYVADGVLPKEAAIEKVNLADFTDDSSKKAKILPEDLLAAEDKELIKAKSGAPGCSCGQLVFTPEKAAELSEGDQEYIYVSKICTAEDFQTLIQSKGVITIDGSANSYAAAVATYGNIPAVIGCKGLELDMEELALNIGEKSVHEGDMVTLDGDHGVIYIGQLPLHSSGSGSISEHPEIQQIIQWGDEIRQERRKNKEAGKKALMVYVTTDNAEDASKARASGTGGAEGVGLLNTTQMLLGERTDMVQRLLIGHDEEEDRDATRNELEEQMNGEFGALFETMNGYPVVIRLSDPQVKEYLPDVLELIEDMTITMFKKSKGEEIEEEEIHEKEITLEKVKHLHDPNPIVGLRGIRLIQSIPGLLKAQIRAIVEAVYATADKDMEVMPYIAVPFLTCASELDLVRPILETAVQQISKEHSEQQQNSESEAVKPKFKLAAMIEVPRAVFIADQLAKKCDMLVFNTDILTQQAYGIEQSEAEKTFLPQYALMGIFKKPPLKTDDPDGISKLLEIGLKKAKEANPECIVGATGVQCSSPAAVALFHKLGFDFVSCSVDSLSIVRLAAAKAVLSDK